MASIIGASKYLGAATLANLKQLPAQSTDLLSSVASSISLLDVGRANQVKGIGLSASARAYNAEFLKNSNATANGLFSATAGADSTLEGLQKQVLALRSGMSPDRVAPSLRGENVDTKA